MVGYTVTWQGRSSKAQDEPEVADDAEATPADSWLEWLEYAHEDILLAGGDDTDYDTLLSYALGHNEVETDAKIAEAEKRAGKFAVDTLREARDSNNKIAAVLRQQLQQRQERTAEAAALARRLDEMTDAITAVTRENGALTARLMGLENEFARAIGALEKEIARERSLRRLLDAQRNRPRTQKTASELTRRFAERTLEAQSKAVATSKSEEAA
jgi:hypothetical protein